MYVNGHLDHEFIDCGSSLQCLTTAANGLVVSVDLGPYTGLDEVGLWRRPLGKEEVLTLYHQPTDDPHGIEDSPLWVAPLNGESECAISRANTDKTFCVSIYSRLK